MITRKRMNTVLCVRHCRILRMTSFHMQWKRRLLSRHCRWRKALPALLKRIRILSCHVYQTRFVFALTSVRPTDISYKKEWNASAHTPRRVVHRELLTKRQDSDNSSGVVCFVNCNGPGKNGLVERQVNVVLTYKSWSPASVSNKHSTTCHHILQARRGSTGCGHLHDNRKSAESLR